MLAINYPHTVHKNHYNYIRLETKLYENTTREQAAFRSKISRLYSTTDHIHVINQLKEKCREYIPLSVAFSDYKKTFDSVQTQAVLLLFKCKNKE